MSLSYGSALDELSDQTLAALLEFYADAEHKRSCGVEKEDWQLSQFWYDDRTADVLARECLHQCAGAAADDDHTPVIGCVSSPTVFVKLKELKEGAEICRSSPLLPPSPKLLLFEFDRRFAKYGSEFVFYDYDAPLDAVDQWRHSCDVVVADPPFLSEPCVRKVFDAVQLLSRQKFIFCTGLALEPFLLKQANVHRCSFSPSHRSKLGNEFRCYANYATSLLDSDDTDLATCSKASESS